MIKVSIIISLYFNLWFVQYRWFKSPLRLLFDYEIFNIIRNSHLQSIVIKTIEVKRFSIKYNDKEKSLSLNLWCVSTEKNLNWKKKDRSSK